MRRDSKEPELGEYTLIAAVAETGVHSPSSGVVVLRVAQETFLMLGSVDCG